MIEIFERERKLPIIKTENLVLKNIRIEDITEDYIAWLNDPEITKYLEIRLVEQTREKVKEFIKSKLDDIVHSKHFGVYDQKGKRLIGTVTLPNINLFHKFADVSFVIGMPDAQGKGYATEAVQAVVTYAFRYCTLEKLWAGYYESHVGSQKVLSNCGFKVEGRIKKKLIDFTGKRVDHIIVGLQKNDWLTDHFK